jgi:hypothetical protein
MMLFVFNDVSIFKVKQPCELISNGVEAISRRAASDFTVILVAVSKTDK